MQTMLTVGRPRLSKMLADPFAHYDEIRAQCRVSRSDKTGTLVVTGYDSANTLFRDEAVRSDLLPGRLIGADAKRRDASSRRRLLVGEQKAFKDRSEHRRIRDVVRRSFSPTVVRSMADQIRQHARNFAREVGSHLDLMSALAYPLPARVTNDMLGVPKADHARFIDWSNRLVDFVGRSAVDNEYLNQRRRNSANGLTIAPNSRSRSWHIRPS